MGHSNGKITAPVSIYDVQQTLGDSSNDLKTLCNSDKINKWARFKPINLPKVQDLTDADREAANFGLTAPFTLNHPDIDQLKNARWTYAHISTSNYARLTDFNKYSHKALQPVSGYGDIVLSVVKNYYSFVFYTDSLARDDSFSIMDINSIKNYYACIVIDAGDYGLIYKTADQTFAEGVLAVELKLSDMSFLKSGGVYPYIMCGCDTVHTNMDAAMQLSKFMALPSDDAMYGTITYDPSPHLYFKFTGVKSGNTEAGLNQFEDISKYDSKDINNQISQYLNVAPSGNLTLLGFVRNDNSGTINLLKSAITYKVVNNLIGATTVDLVPDTLYEATEPNNFSTNLTETSVISLLQGETKYFVIKLASGICVVDEKNVAHVVDDGTEADMMIYLYINKTLVSTKNIQVRWGRELIGPIL